MLNTWGKKFNSETNLHEKLTYQTKLNFKLFSDELPKLLMVNHSRNGIWYISCHTEFEIFHYKNKVY